MATYKEIQAQIEALQKQAEEARNNEVLQVIIQIKQLMMDNGITVADLSSTRKNAVKKSARPAKYRDPKTGQEWTGRGRIPNWLAGKNKDKFLV